MRKALKFLHTLGSVGMLGALAGMLVMHSLFPGPGETLELATLRLANARLAQWLLLPSLGLVLVSGLLAMAVGPGFHNAGWAWLKLALGVVMFEGTLLAVQGPAERGAEVARQVLAGELPPAALAQTASSEWYSLWIIAGVAVLNVLLGIWRPRLSRRRADG